MLIVDRREREICDELKRFDIPFEIATIDDGDCQFSTRADFFSADDGNPYGLVGGAEVGIERKHVSDLINSMRDRRLSGKQLRGMWQCFNLTFLFIEDQWRPTATGAIEIYTHWKWHPLRGGQNAGAYRQIDAYLTTLALKGNVQVRRTLDVRETAEQWVNLWRWFNEKTWKQHHSHDQVYAPDPNDCRERGGKARFSHIEPTYTYKVAAQLPGIDRRAEQVANKFKTILKWAVAGTDKWREIDGIGEITAEMQTRIIAGEELSQEARDLMKRLYEIL